MRSHDGRGFALVDFEPILEHSGIEVARTKPKWPGPESIADQQLLTLFKRHAMGLLMVAPDKERVWFRSQNAK